MSKSSLLAGLIALALFANAQYEGWNLFEQEAGATATRSVSGGRYHK